MWTRQSLPRTRSRSWKPWLSRSRPSLIPSRPAIRRSKGNRECSREGGCPCFQPLRRAQEKHVRAFCEGSEGRCRNFQGHCASCADDCGFSRKVRCRIALESFYSVRLKSFKLFRSCIWPVPFLTYCGPVPDGPSCCSNPRLECQSLRCCFMRFPQDMLSKSRVVVRTACSPEPRSPAKGKMFTNGVRGNRVANTFQHETFLP